MASLPQPDLSSSLTSEIPAFVPRSLPSELNAATPSVSVSNSTSPPAETKTGSVVPSTYAQVTQISGAPNGSTFTALNESTGRPVLIRLFPWLSGNANALSALQIQANLLRLVVKDICNEIVELDLAAPIPRLVQDAPHSSSLADYLATINSSERLNLASEIARSIDRAFAVGLYHGVLNENSIRLTSSGQLTIDYFERFSNRNKFAQIPVRELHLRDLLGTFDIILMILGPVIHDENIYSFLPARQFAILKRLLRSHDEPISPEKLFEQWLDFLSHWKANPSVASSAAYVDDEHTHEMAPSVQPNYQGSSPAPESHAPVVTPPALHSDTCAIQPTVGANQTPSKRSVSNDGTDELLLDAPNVRSQSSKPLSIGDTLGRFRLDSVLGRGGMGVVYRGTDLTNNSIVAIKVLQFNGGDIAHAIRRFKKEARILSSIQNPYVTALLDVGEERGVHYLAMEFIDGTSLKDWLKSRLPIEEKDALQIVADICRALSGAHSQGIIHRDIKPDNILLAKLPNSPTDVPAVELDLSQLMVKLTDFGIARHVQQSSSMELTRAGTLLGTPMYMSPEQCKGHHEVGPPADIYALGITLFELLTGAVPYRADDPMKLAAMHCFDPLPSVRKRNKLVSDRAATIVAQMLAKDPSKRFAHAEQLATEIDRTLAGEATDFEVHPRLPEHVPNKLWEKVFTWDLKSDARDLWPHVSNTDRLNHAAGLPSVEYETRKDPNGGLRKFGSFKLGGVRIVWEEHPFEWIEGVRMGVLREFSSGPFKWFMNSVELQPLPEGGTRLVHTVRIDPRNTFGKIISTIEAGWKGGKALDRIYRRIDAHLQRQSETSNITDPFQESPRLSSSIVARIEQRAAAMAQFGVPIVNTGLLTNFLKTAPPQSLAKIRSIELAKQFDVDANEFTDTCLVAAKCGLLELQWDILCPTCRAPAKSQSLLTQIGEHTECEACDVEFQSNVGNAIELVFRVHPEVRTAESSVYCIGGPGHSPHVISQLRLAPGEKMNLILPVSNGDYIVRSNRLTHVQGFKARANSRNCNLDLRLSQLGASTHAPDVQTGQLSLRITNDLQQQHLVRIERAIERASVVTAAAITATPRFRELFPEQTFHQKVPVATQDLTLMACHLSNVDQLYAEQGESETYALLQVLLDELEHIVSLHRGAVVKSLSEGILASFNDCSDATRAAFAIRESISANDHLSSLKIGLAIHRGSTLISTQNGRLDYFGRTARLVQNIVQQFEEGIAITETVFSDVCVQQILASNNASIQTRSASFAGSPNTLIQLITNAS